jgi:hypothetical protein
MIVAVRTLAKPKSDIKVDMSDDNFQAIVERLCHTKETGVSYVLIIHALQ